MEITRLFDFLSYQRQELARPDALNTKYNGEWKATSSELFYQQAHQISSGLLEMGVQPGDKIGMISSNNRTEWCIVDMGVLQLGAINVPIYPTITANDYEYILNHSESQYCFVSDKEVYDKLVSVKKNIKGLKGIFVSMKLKMSPSVPIGPRSQGQKSSRSGKAESRCQARRFGYNYLYIWTTGIRKE